MFGLDFHHLGLAATDPRAALNFHHGLGYRSSAPLYDPLQNVMLTMCLHAHMPAVEIIAPGETRGPVSRLLARHPKGLVYHSCFTTPDVAAAIAAMEVGGLEVVCTAPPEPAVLFAGAPVSFHLVGGVGLIEIIETADPAGLARHLDALCVNGRA